MKYTSEELRQLYNKYYSSGENKWALVNLKEARKLVRTIIKWLNIKSLTNGKKEVLDIGCAQGYLSEAFHLSGYSVVGIDYSDVAIHQAKDLFPNCDFIHMDGLNPSFTKQFDIIFCRGFSGSNSHDIDFIESWISKYLNFLKKDGYFIIGTWTNFSGLEKENETVNWKKSEIINLIDRLNPLRYQIKFYHYFGFMSAMKKFILKYILNELIKENVYIIMTFSSEK